MLRLLGVRVIHAERVTRQAVERVERVERLAHPPPGPTPRRVRPPSARRLPRRFKRRDLPLSVQEWFHPQQYKGLVPHTSCGSDGSGSRPERTPGGKTPEMVLEGPALEASRCLSGQRGLPAHTPEEAVSGHGIGGSIGASAVEWADPRARRLLAEEQNDRLHQLWPTEP